MVNQCKEIVFRKKGYNNVLETVQDIPQHPELCILGVTFQENCRFSIPVKNFFFSVSVKVLPVTSRVSGVFVHRAFCAYFLRIERVVELRRFLWWTQ